MCWREKKAFQPAPSHGQSRATPASTKLPTNLALHLLQLFWCVCGPDSPPFFMLSNFQWENTLPLCPLPAPLAKPAAAPGAVPTWHICVGKGCPLEYFLQCIQSGTRINVEGLQTPERIRVPWAGREPQGSSPALKQIAQTGTECANLALWALCSNQLS